MRVVLIRSNMVVFYPPVTSGQDPSPSTTTMCPGNAVFLLLEIEQVLDELDQLGKGGKEDDDNEENNGFNGGRGRCSMMMMALGQGGSCVGTKDGKGGKRHTLGHDKEVDVPQDDFIMCMLLVHFVLLLVQSRWALPQYTPRQPSLAPYTSIHPIMLPPPLSCLSLPRLFHQQQPLPDLGTY